MPLALVWELLAIDKASPVFGRVGAAAGATATTTERAMARYTTSMRRASAVGSKLTRRFTLPIAAIGAVSVKMATDFNASMTKIQTQAGGSAKDVKVLSGQVLALAKYAEQGPDELAKSLYHLKSVGLANVPAMQALRQSADFAAVGQAGLEETTNALAGAWRTGIKGATNFHQAVSTLNAVIGAGNMRMEDLNLAIGTGILPTAKTFGLTLKDVGSALALFTDEGVDSASAATRLRMSLSLLAAPSGAAEKQLKSIGLTGNKLGEDMRKPNGLIVAIGDLKSHLDASGLSATKQAALLSHAFGGGRSSSAILALVNNFDVLKFKQDQVTASIGKYNAAVAAQRATPEAKFKLLESSLQRSAILLGNQLLPMVIKAADGIASVAEHFNNLSSGQKKVIVYSALALAALGPVLAIIGRIGLAFKAMWVAGLATSRFFAGIRAAEISMAGMETQAYASGLAVRRMGLRMGALGLGATGLAGGLTTTALALGTIGDQGETTSFMKRLMDSFEYSTHSADKSAKALIAWSLSSKSVGAGADIARPALKDLGVSVDGIAAAVAGADGPYQTFLDKLKAQGKLGKLTKQVLDELHGTYANTAPIKAAGDAIAATGKKAKEAHADLTGLGFATTVSKLAMAEAKKAADHLTNALKNLDHGMLGLADAQIAFKLGLKDLPGQIAKHDKAIRGDSRAALQNRQALVSLLGQVKAHGQAMQDAGRKAPAVARAIDGDVAALERVATKAGVSKTAFWQLIRQMHLTPKQVKTKLIVDDYAAISKLTGMQQYLALLARGVTVPIRTKGSLSYTPGIAPPPGHARGGGVADGYFTAGEGGWELGRKSGSRLEFFSHSASQAMTGLPARLPGYAKGTDVTVGGTTYSTRKEANTAVDKAWRQFAQSLKRFGRTLTKTGADVKSAFSPVLDALRTAGVDHDALRKLAAADNALARKVNIRNRDMDKLTGLIGARRAESANVRGAVTGSFTLASSGTGFDSAQKPTFGNIFAQATQDKNIIRKWVAGLKKLGRVFGKSATGKQMLRQLAEAGPSSYPQVAALVAARPGQLASLIATERQIGAYGRSAGDFVGGKLYNDRIADARATVREDRREVVHALHQLIREMERITDRRIVVKVGRHEIATAVAEGNRANARRK